MSAHVLIYQTYWGKTIKHEAILSILRNNFNKFNNI